LARNQWASGDNNSAISRLELWLEGNPEDKRALMVIAEYLFAANRPEEAKKAYKTLGDLIPDNDTVLNNLAWLMMDTDVDQGIIYAKKALKINPEGPYIKDTLAMLLLKSGQNKEALVYSEEAANSAPNDFDILINYSKILRANGHKTEARKVLTDLLANIKDSNKRREIQNELNKL
ncbi:MAG: tetratricopeptide repeat protein, partial [Deltaproteobacteria bacterium]|nr:tetratricopeptide repeat protein [Deltaproteobacteria bacterium]